jgi:glycosyltransferase involved in cell wall biosynthesis
MDVPEFFPQGYERRFGRRVETIVRWARAIVTTTTQVAKRIECEYQGRGLALVPIHVEPLPSPLAQAGEIDERQAGFLGGVPYFVVISTIEPQKNHPLLIQVWRALIQRGVMPPKLVIVGKRGWESEQTFRELDLAPDLGKHVIEVASLPSAHHSQPEQERTGSADAELCGTIRIADSRGAIVGNASRLFEYSSFSRSEPGKGVANIAARWLDVAESYRIADAGKLSFAG